MYLWYVMHVMHVLYVMYVMYVTYVMYEMYVMYVMYECMYVCIPVVDYGSILVNSGYCGERRLQKCGGGIYA